MENNIFNPWRLSLILLAGVGVAGLLYWAGTVLPKSGDLGKSDGRDAAGTGKTESGMVAVARNIVVESPAAGDRIVPPLKLRGRARGAWFFEGSFPVQLVDGDGRVLASGQAEAQGEWMTEEFVPFTFESDFIPGQSKSATLILSRDNPSGLPENAEHLEIPVGL